MLAGWRRTFGVFLIGGASVPDAATGLEEWAGRSNQRRSRAGGGDLRGREGER
jgi:hypothetical protein